MNRQLIALLSLFSLVLVLSVYYVLMPGVNSNIGNNSEMVNTSLHDATTLYFETLDLNREQIHQEYIDEMIDVYEGTNTSYSLEEAYLNIDKRNKIIEQEDKIEECIKGLGYSSCYAEVNDHSIKVIVYSTNNNHQEETSQIIYQVQSMLNIDMNNFIVEFKS